MDSIQASPILEVLNGINIKSVENAYKENRLAVDSLLAADTLDANFWRIYGYQVTHLFVQANKSSKMAMSIFLPFFILVFVIVVVIIIFKLLVLRPDIGNAVKPKNDPHLNDNESEGSEIIIK